MLGVSIIGVGLFAVISMATGFIITLLDHEPDTNELYKISKEQE